MKEAGLRCLEIGRVSPTLYTLRDSSLEIHRSKAHVVEMFARGNCCVDGNGRSITASASDA